MKLGELCEIVIEPMQVEPEGYDAFLVDGVSFQQKIHQCSTFSFWDIKEISSKDRITIKIVEPKFKL